MITIHGCCMLRPFDLLTLSQELVLMCFGLLCKGYVDCMGGAGSVHGVI